MILNLPIMNPVDVDITQKRILRVDKIVYSNTMKQDNDRSLYIAAHIFLRNTLSAYNNILPESWSFVKSKYGKPSIRNKEYEHLTYRIQAV